MYRCVKCEGDVGNGGLDACIIVSDLDPDRPGMTRQLRFCRANGCDKKVLNGNHVKFPEEIR